MILFGPVIRLCSGVCCEQMCLIAGNDSFRTSGSCQVLSRGRTKPPNGPKILSLVVRRSADIRPDSVNLPQRLTFSSLTICKHPLNSCFSTSAGVAQLLLTPYPHLRDRTDGKALNFSNSH